ncbi:hypothetical protein GCM10007052_35150 [Halioglobus japonicus]|nr:hypothetical protein GCM10007052_35150 [Halioglobus japonicus]
MAARARDIAAIFIFVMVLLPTVSGFNTEFAPDTRKVTCVKKFLSPGQGSALDKSRWVYDVNNNTTPEP